VYDFSAPCKKTSNRYLFRKLDKDHRPTLFTENIEIELQKCKQIDIDCNFHRFEEKVLS